MAPKSVVNSCNSGFSNATSVMNRVSVTPVVSQTAQREDNRGWIGRKAFCWVSRPLYMGMAETPSTTLHVPSSKIGALVTRFTSADATADCRFLLRALVLQLLLVPLPKEDGSSANPEVRSEEYNINVSIAIPITIVIEYRMRSTLLLLVLRW
jgi:hypothetical protein